MIRWIITSLWLACAPPADSRRRLQIADLSNLQMDPPHSAWKMGLYSTLTPTTSAALNRSLLFTGSRSASVITSGNTCEPCQHPLGAVCSSAVQASSPPRRPGELAVGWLPQRARRREIAGQRDPVAPPGPTFIHDLVPSTWNQRPKSPTPIDGTGRVHVAHKCTSP